MGGWTVRRWTGTAGAAGVVLQLAGLAVFLSAGSPSGLNTTPGIVNLLRSGGTNVEAAALLFFVSFAITFVFIAGFRALIIEAGPRYDYLGTAIFGLGATGAILGYVSLGLVAAAAANATTNASTDVVHSLFVASGVIGGAPSAVALGFFLGLAGSALSATAILPRWTAWLSWAASILVLASAPALYGGDNASAFYTANGLVTIIALVPLLIWQLTISILFLRGGSST